ncbi:type-2 restriction enzyme Cfr10I (plasmid) [Nostoc sp. HK-01]|nr:type-2 restriction enzyme Cfr10I [Nostoc sp. HK-01]
MTENFLFLNTDGNISVKADMAFIKLYPLLPKETLINEIHEKIYDLVVAKSKEEFNGLQPTPGSLNNCKGRWNEMSFLLTAHNSIIKNTNDIYLVKMPNESSLKFWQIYTHESRAVYEKLVSKLKNQGFFIRCSNPDFVLIKRRVVENFIPNEEEDLLSNLKDLYKNVKNKCEPSDVISFISLKTSNRPDRRYQILYEANITKYASQYIHNAEHRLRFDVIGRSNESDAQVFKAPLLSSIPIFRIENLEEELELLKSLAIDSDTNISTKIELDKYWEIFSSI